MCNRTLCCGPASAVLLALTLASPVGAQQKAARRELRAASQEIRGFLRARGATAVALEPLASKNATPSNAGPGLCLLLREELLAAGVKISPSADLKVGGFYQVGLDRKSKRPMIYLVLQV